MPTDFSKFKPNSAGDLLDGLVSVAAETAKAAWDKIKQEITYQLNFIAQKTTKVMTQLVAGDVSQSEADFTLHLLELNLNSALVEFKFLAYAAAQKILSAVFGLLKTAIKNVTGISLAF